MSTTRILEIRKSKSLISSALLNVPFGYIQKQFGYPIESIIRYIHCETRFHLGFYPNTFPYIIKEYYWISTDSKSEWIALGVLDSGIYFFYTAHSNAEHPFVNKQGIMSLWVALNYDNLIKFAMTEDVYRRYIAETVAEIL